MKRCNIRSITHSGLLELPSHLIYDILLRLTVDVIFKCKCVCKTFLEILRDPYFVELHLSKAPKDLIMQEGLLKKQDGLMSYFLLICKYRFDLEKPGSSDDDSYPCQSVTIPGIPSRINQYTPPLAVASCNGLLYLCFKYWNNPTCIYYICNPVLGEFVALSPFVMTKFELEYAAFGICPKTKQYKVIRLSSQISEVYTLGTGSWREIGKDVPLPRSPRCIAGCSLNGNLHWITQNCTVSNFVCSFSLETEKFSFISSPAQFNLDNMSNSFFMINLGLLDGLLCFSYFLGNQFEAFVMKNYGRDGYWMKELSIDLSTNYVSRNPMHYAFEFLENGELFFVRDGIITSCNVRNGITRQMSSNKHFGLGVKSFVPSLISLKEIIEVEVAGGHMEVVERKMGRNPLS